MSSSTQSLPSVHELNDTSNVSTPSVESQVKKSRAKGKAAVITDENYKNDLMAEKIRKMKKEKIDSTQHTSEVPIATPKPEASKPLKRKRTSTAANKKK